MPLLLLIRLYWLLWPARTRRVCLFRQSCSRHVYRITRRHGLRAGWQALAQRNQQCRPGALHFTHPLTGAPGLLLADNTILHRAEMAHPRG